MRTDYTALCATCGVRSSARETHRCAGRRRSALAFADVRFGRFSLRWFAGGAAAATVIVGAFVALLGPGSPCLMCVGVVVVVPLVAFAMTVFRQGVERPSPATLRRFAVPVGPTRTLRGRILAEAATLTSPSGRTCVAWQVSGRMGNEVVDDAFTTPLPVVLGDREVRVDGDLSLDLCALDRTRVPILLAPRPSWPAGFLEARGLSGEEATEVREQVLLPGDLVEVRVYGAAEVASELPYRKGSETVIESENVVIAVGAA